MVERRQLRRVTKQLRHCRIEIDERDMADARVAQHLARRKAVAAAQDQHAPRVGHPPQRRPDQRLVIAILIARGELQIAVEIEPEVAAPPGQHDALIGRRAGIDHRLAVNGDFRPALQPLGKDQPDDEAGGHHDRRHQVAPQRAPFLQHHNQRDGDGDIGQPEHQPGADHPQLRHQHQREQQRGGERADIIIGQHVGDQLAKGEAVLQDADQQRDLEPDQDADDEHQAIQRDAEIIDPREQQEQQRRRPAADARR